MSCHYQSRFISQGTSRPRIAVFLGLVGGVSSSRMKILHPHLANFGGTDPVDPAVCHGCGDLDPWSPGSRGLFCGKEKQDEMQPVRQSILGSPRQGKKWMYNMQATTLGFGGFHSNRCSE